MGFGERPKGWASLRGDRGRGSRGSEGVSRLSWDEYFMEITKLVSCRSTCLRRQVGAVLVRDRQILATGYNGPPRGLPHCDEVGCLRELSGIPSGQRHELCRGLHAEQNAIIQAAVHGVSIKGATLYTTTHPCVICSKMIINAGICRVVYWDGYADELSKEMLCQAGIPVERLNKEAP
jgi:dCMP deaminase